ncbi:hypothetical protein SPRG_17110 [Saprolegnia parasitica CBS 223.65]|uniref:Uncharacterized protein n=1 Tax=Saprolegnia parasitica (strain CBS 223.65) TaxID=695850 RepID=A0A067BS22_SAPPC|nr:hypothetical protein SPRG_17110 [Saprolegnia parasitica CBS 223.65]KDO17472.1 hypothetical protein SPRG_17110 [Saprolegnia parasitica CBS 223.65]|eukprot:XP_012211820.1 hypothetical protein SPRG_17110 [Saprolegnia parasitica CBS 223.65]
MADPARSDGIKVLEDAQRKLDEALAKGKKDIVLKKVRPYTIHEKLFSNSSIPPLPKVAAATEPAPAIGGDEKKKAESKASIKASSAASKNLKLKVKKRKHKDTIGSEDDEAAP